MSALGSAVSRSDLCQRLSASRCFGHVYRDTTILRFGHAVSGRNRELVFTMPSHDDGLSPQTLSRQFVGYRFRPAVRQLVVVARRTCGVGVPGHLDLARALLRVIGNGSNHLESIGRNLGTSSLKVDDAVARGRGDRLL